MTNGTIDSHEKLPEQPDVPDVGAEGRRVPGYLVPALIVAFFALVGIASVTLFSSGEPELTPTPEDPENPIFTDRKPPPAPPPAPPAEPEPPPQVAEPAAQKTGLTNEQLRLLLAQQELARREQAAQDAESRRRQEQAAQEARARDQATEGALLDYSVSPAKQPAAESGSPATLANTATEGSGNVGNADGYAASLENYKPPATAFVGRLPNLSTRVTQGRIIDAMLETAISTELPGMIRAFVSEDVYSHNGRCLLVPKYSTLIGEHSSAVRKGGYRVAVIWDRIITPDGRDVTIRSPATDSVGRSGVPGEVDRHLLERFGASVLLSLLSIQEGGQQDEPSSAVADEFKSTAEIALSDSIGIPPTVYVPHGQTHLKVFVARDMEFAGVMAGTCL